MSFSFLWVCTVAITLQLSRSEDPVVSFPSTFIAEYTTIAHQISESNEYPSRTKRYKLYYNRNLGAARIEYRDENEIDVKLIRNYRDHYEIRIESFGGVETCEYSFLSQKFPLPDFPKDLHNDGERKVGNTQVVSFSTQSFRQYFDIMVSSDLSLPYAVNEYWINEDNKPIPVYSIVYTVISQEVPDSNLFDVLTLKNSGKCSHNSKGWPYQHIFGPFVKV